MKNVHFGTFLLVLLVAATSQDKSFHSPQKCILKIRSKCGTPISCDSDPPYPLVMTTTINLSQKVKWNGQSSWQYAIEDSNRTLTPIASGCIAGQSVPMQYNAGSNITLNFVCHRLPRELKEGDKIWVYVFGDRSDPDNWLYYYIPIEGFSPLQPLERSDKPQQYTEYGVLQGENQSGLSKAQESEYVASLRESSTK